MATIFLPANKNRILCYRSVSDKPGWRYGNDPQSRNSIFAAQTCAPRSRRAPSRMTLGQSLFPMILLAGEEDAHERSMMESGGWKIRLSTEAAGTPERYQSYIQESRGEISVVKPSCIFFQNAWMSVRSLCYLASGKPVVVQNTGPSVYLPDGDGLLRFSNAEQAVAAIESINGSYLHHCQSAREIAEEYFDSQKVLSSLLNQAI